MLETVFRILNLRFLVFVITDLQTFRIRFLESLEISFLLMKRKLFGLHQGGRWSQVAKPPGNPLQPVPPHVPQEAAQQITAAGAVV